MISKPLDQILNEDFNYLLENEVYECKQLDYKEVLNLGTSEERLELMTDIAAFANTSGGDMLSMNHGYMQGI